MKKVEIKKKNVLTKIANKFFFLYHYLWRLVFEQSTKASPYQNPGGGAISEMKDKQKGGVLYWI